MILCACLVPFIQRISNVAPLQKGWHRARKAMGNRLAVQQKYNNVRFAHQINKPWDALFWEMRQPSYQGNIKKCAEVSRGAFMMPMPTLLYYFYWQWHWTGSPSWTFAFAKEMSDMLLFWHFNPCTLAITYSNWFKKKTLSWRSTVQLFMPVCNMPSIAVCCMGQKLFSHHAMEQLTASCR